MDSTVTTVGQARRFDLPRLALADGTVEALKWIGLLLMTIDHANKYLLHGSVPAMFAVGRLSLPLFAFVLAHNLARPGALAGAARVYPRTLARLAGAAAVATVPFTALGGLAAGWWPLNILATFAVSVAAMYLLLRGGAWRKACAIILVVMGGGLVEYWWPAIGMCLAAWYYCRRPSWTALTLWVVATLALNLNGWAFGRMPVANASMWALAAFPLIFAATRLKLRLPRMQWLFYAYFPLHLSVLWLLQHGR
jgi:hypothetical protein